jgi:hypothetical protein
MVMKHPRVQGCEKWGVKGSEVMILDKMFVVSLIYIYVAVCRFYVVGCLINFLFYNYFDLCFFFLTCQRLIVRFAGVPLGKSVTSQCKWSFSI